MSDPAVRVVLVDDDPLVRAALRLMLGGASGVEVVGEAGNGAEGLDVVDRTRPDVVLMDIRMPRMDGLAATQQLLRRPDPPRVVVLTTFDADEYVLRALAGGASGFLFKDTSPPMIVEAIHRVAAGEPMLSPSVTAQLIRRVVSAPAAGSDAGRARAAARLATLSEREREVAVAVGRGRSDAEITGALHEPGDGHGPRVAHPRGDGGGQPRPDRICVHEAGLA